MSKLRDTKSILAKLLANENITVSHQNVKTSYFNIKDRVLVCPIWKEMDGNLYDLFLGHEIGHALNTPQEGWHDAPYKDKDGNQMPPIFKDILNVLEDARIEKKIKRKYPGLSRSFFHAYKNLHERNFFNVLDLKSYEELNIIDRINLNNKVGSLLKIPFYEIEKEIIKEVAKLETWEDVEILAWKIYDLLEKEEDEPESPDIQSPEAEQTLQETNNTQEEIKEQEIENESSGDQSNDQTKSKENSAEQNSENDLIDGELKVSEEDNSDDVDGENTNSSMQEVLNKESVQTMRSMTDKAFREKEKEFISDDGAIYLLTLPEANYENIMLKNDEVMNDLESFIIRQIQDKESFYFKNKMGYDAVVRKATKEFNRKNKQIILQILKEFNMKKCAVEYTKTFVTRTGELEMNALYKYKFTNNIFKKIETKNKGKSHGVIIFIDLSSSMQQILRNTIEQMLILISFCKMAQLPFDVYGFSNGNHYNKTLIKMNRKEKFDLKSEYELYIPARNFHLKHLIGSKLSNKAYKRSFNNLLVMLNEYNSTSNEENGNFQNDWTDAGFNLHGTPYVETLLASRKLIKEFKQTYNLDIVNVLYLTDGEGNHNSIRYPSHIDLNKSTIYFIDKTTQKKIKRPNGFNIEQSVMTQLVQQVTSCKHIGFYLCDMKQMKDLLFFLKENKEDRKISDSQLAEMYKNVQQNKFFSCSNIGYDKYFYIRSSNSNIEDDELNIQFEMDEKTMQYNFNKFQTNKRNNRILLSKMAEEIATGL